MQDELTKYEEQMTDEEDAFAFLERDARRYHKAFGEEEEAKRV